MTEEKECDICKNPDSTDPAMNLCDKHLEEATKPEPKETSPLH